MITLPPSTVPLDSQLAPEARESATSRARRILTEGPRPDDYLPVPDEIVTFVDGAEGRTGVKLLPEYRRKMISCLALQEDHAGIDVLVHHTPDGVVVLGTGLDETFRLFESLTPAEQSRVSFEFPPTPDVWPDRS